MNANVKKHNFTNMDPILASFFAKRSRDDTFFSRNKAKYRFGQYHSYDEIMAWMEDIERLYPGIAKVFNLGSTHEGRPIKGIKIGFPIQSVSKRAVWIDGGLTFEFARVIPKFN